MFCIFLKLPAGEFRSLWVQVLSRAHALSSVFRAVNDYLNERLKSRNIHSEIVFSLSPTNNVR